MQTKVIQSKMKSIKNIRKITKTMEMVSVSKMKRATNQVTLGVSYTEHAERIIQSVSSEHVLAHPLVHLRTDGRILLILIAADKGLCGGYNTLIYRTLMQSMDIQNTDIITIGKHAAKIARRAGAQVIASFHTLPEQIDESAVYPIAAMILSKFTDDILYQRISTLSQSITSGVSYMASIRPFLPLRSYTGQLDIDTPETEQYIFEPSASSVLDVVFPELLRALLMQRLLQARSAEHTARMVAMKNATDNATTYYDALKLTYNRARQAGITQEIAEIVGGASALMG